MTQTTVAVVLAGGLARRMGGGGDKAFVRLAGRKLLDHVLDRVGPQAAAVAVNANGDPARFSAWDVPIVADTIPGFPGPLAGVLAGMRWARREFPRAPALLSVPTDTPFLPRDLVARLYAARRATGLQIARAASGGRVHPVVALWPVALADTLEAALRAGERKVETWSARFGVATAEFDAEDGGPFFNINSPADLAAAESTITGRVAGPSWSVIATGE